MKRCSLMVILVGAIALLGGALAPPGGAVAQPQPTLTITPASGPCDATVEVTGRDFPPSKTITLAVTAPGTPTRLNDVASAVADPNGGFAVGTHLGFLGCEAAALNGESGPGPREIRVVAEFERPLQDEKPAPEVSASYSYTTRRVPEPGPILIVTPAAGPCDATVEVKGTGFLNAMHVQLYLGRPHSEGDLGTLTTATADLAGELNSVVSLGALGCEAAALDTLADAAGEPRELFICGDIAGTPFPPGLSCGTYLYTTTRVSPGLAPEALPRAGYGLEQSRGTNMQFLGLLLVLVAGAALLVAVALAWRRSRV